MRMPSVLQPFFTWAGTELFIGRIEQFSDGDVLHFVGSAHLRREVQEAPFILHRLCYAGSSSGIQGTFSHGASGRGEECNTQKQDKTLPVGPIALLLGRIACSGLAPS